MSAAGQPSPPGPCAMFAAPSAQCRAQKAAPASQIAHASGRPGEGADVMIVVVFQVTMREGQEQRYFDLAAALRPELEGIEGFLSVERFASLAVPGKYVSLSFWRDEAAVARWR